ncbi:F-box only protein 2-like [Aphis craccivora]|uniref:F-box only protein 2-like n=1 Tax=Aphis craccivora TaxID=307492 RepID=A0A6G0ZIP6_APHCR|nr:F-box only protein 2-like [Aphis craccivora]
MEVLKNNQTFDLLPNEMVINTFILIDTNTLLDCRLVCKRWQKLIFKFVNNSRGYSGFSQISSNDIRKIELPWYVFYVISKYNSFNRNLIKNHCGQDLCNHWETDIDIESVLWTIVMIYNYLLFSAQISHVEHLLSDPDFDWHTSFFGVDFGYASVHSEINETKVVSGMIETTGHEIYLKLNHFVKRFYTQILIHSNLEVTCSVVKILLPIKYKNSNLL